jgi:hypothetical protein
MNVLERAFERIGARVKFNENVPRGRNVGRIASEDLALDVRSDAKGEYFLISRNAAAPAELLALDTQPRDRHLLLLYRRAEEKHRFLLGHDERHWFVAAIPENAPVSSVRDAKDALKPEAVHIGERGLRSTLRDRRSNAARVRQGEWFFLPAPQLVVKDFLILRNEPLSRGRGNKPHVCDELFRMGGETVYVDPSHPNGVTEQEFAALSESERNRSGWRVMRRNPRAWARGRVRHPDHKTVHLDGWHEILMNTESLAHAMRNVVFLD